MNPCRDCLKAFGDSLCSELGHCVFEGTDEKPQMGLSTDHIKEKNDGREVVIESTRKIISSVA